MAAQGNRVYGYNQSGRETMNVLVIVLQLVVLLVVVLLHGRRKPA